MVHFNVTWVPDAASFNDVDIIDEIIAFWIGQPLTLFYFCAFYLKIVIPDRYVSRLYQASVSAPFPAVFGPEREGSLLMLSRSVCKSSCAMV